jgi:competence protein ComEC
MNFLKTKRCLIISLLLAVVLVTAGCAGLSDLSKGAVSYSHQADELAVHFLDVGQGDSILIQFPNDSVMLIDAGPDRSGAPVISYLKQQGVKKIDYLVATHPHADHIGGMAAVIKEFDISKVYMPKVTHTTKTFEDMLLSIKKKGLKITPARAGLNIFEQDGCLQATFTAPCSSGYDSLNNYSAVVKIQYGSTSFLLTGDAEDLSEKEMLASGMNLQADVLKVGHHGSSSSTTPAFLKSVSPEYAVILVGAANDYGHPHQETLDNLADAGVIIYRTDEEGTIIFVSDGMSVKKV